MTDIKTYEKVCLNIRHLQKVYKFRNVDMANYLSMTNSQYFNKLYHCNGRFNLDELTAIAKKLNTKIDTLINNDLYKY